MKVYSIETSDTDHNIDVDDPVIPSVQGEADGLPDGHRPIAIDKPTEVISGVVDPVIPSVLGRLTGCQTAIAPSPSKAKKETGCITFILKKHSLKKENLICLIVGYIGVLSSSSAPLEWLGHLIVVSIREAA